MVRLLELQALQQLLSASLTQSVFRGVIGIQPQECVLMEPLFLALNLAAQALLGTVWDAQQLEATINVVLVITGLVLHVLSSKSKFKPVAQETSIGTVRVAWQCREQDLKYAIPVPSTTSPTATVSRSYEVIYERALIY